MRFSDLPSPEERINKGIHTGQRDVVQSILGSLVPILPVIPERAIRVRRGIRFDTPQVEATIVETVAVFSGESDTEVGLAGKIRSNSRQKKKDWLMVAHMVVSVFFHCWQALSGQTPPIFPSTAGTLTGSVLG